MSLSVYVPKTSVHVSTHVFDPSADTSQRTVAAHTLIGDAIPHGATILRCFHRVETTFTSAADTATIGLSLDGWTGDLVTGIAINDGSNPWDAAQNFAAA